MTVQIVNLNSIFAQFPYTLELNNELHSACPFCKPEDHRFAKIHLNKQGKRFVGDDRFFWFAEAQHFYCRHCGNHSVEEVCSLLFDNQYALTDSFDTNIQEYASTKEKKPLYLHDEAYINALHANVRRDYWYKNGWTDRTIDRFRLGYGGMYPFSQKAHRHVIPFQPTTISAVADGYALEGRLSHNVKGEQRNIKTQGLSNEYFAAFIEDETSIAVLTEGVKDAVTAWQLGYRHIYALLGSATQIESMALHIVKQGYQQIIAFMDNDKAGENYLAKIAPWVGNLLYTLRWPPNAKQGYDLTDLLVEYGSDVHIYLTQNIHAVSNVVRGFIEDVRVFDPEYAAPSIEGIKPVSVIRSELPDVLNEFIDNYKLKRREAGRGVVKILGGDPGIGKSYAMVRMAEILAKRALREAEIERTAIDKQIAEFEAQIKDLTNPEEIIEMQAHIDRYVNRRENLSVATILYAGPFINGWDDIIAQGADPELWFNHEARNESNCDNLSTVSQLAAKGYMPSAYCHLACPLKAACEQRGYLAQTKERRNKPITYVRHQQLRTTMVNEYRYIFIDENCLNIFDAPLVVGVEELVPTYSFWDSHITEDQVHLVDELIDAVRSALRSVDEDRTYSGRQVMSRIDEHLLGKLSEILALIDPDTVASYQPSTVMGNIDWDNVPMRCLPTIYNVLVSEIDLYNGDEINYNSGLHINKGKYEIYSLDRMHVAQSHPIIVSDGTPFPSLYGLLFDREIEVYAPEIYDPRSTTTVLYGSDFTRTSIKQQLGFGLQDFNRWLEDNHMLINDVLGDEFDLTNLPVDDNIYDSGLMKRIIALLKSYAEKHSSILFVTYKSIRALIEHRMRELYPDLNAKIEYGHYWSLRGTNRYKDIEAVFLVGCPRVAYDVLHRRIQAWAKLTGLPWIPANIEYRITPYSGVNRYEGHTHPTLSGIFADSFVSMVESGEIQQVAARIRPYSSGIPKHIYAAVSRPALKWVTSLDRVGAVAGRLDNQRYRDAYEFMQKHYAQHKSFPSYQTIADTYHLSNTKIKEIRSKIKDG